MIKNTEQLIRLEKNSFVRIYDNGTLGYINNQLTYHDRIYNESGADFLSQITRRPRKIQDVISSLCDIYTQESVDSITLEFLAFLESLHHAGFIVIGDTEDQLNNADMEFSYDIENPKTQSESFIQNTQEEPDLDTESFYLDHDKRKPRIANIQLELTGRCNERCIHCYIPNSSKDSGIDMSFDLVKKIINSFTDLGGYHITLSGGEALLHKDIIQILRFCREKDLQISLLSNLISLTDEMVEVLKEVNLSLVQVSLYSMNPEIHDMITTVKGSFNRTKAAIEKLHKANVPLQISCPIMKANHIGYDKVLEYARSLKIKAQTDYIMMAQSDGCTDNLANRISIEETRTVLQDILDYDHQYDELLSEVKPIKSLDIDQASKLPICGAGLNEICVAANGNAFPCAGWQSFVVGNLYTQSLEDIWFNSPKLLEVRAVTRKDFPKCLICDDREYCNICLVRNYNESNGDMFAINPHNCKVARLNREMVELAKGNVWAQKLKIQ